MERSLLKSFISSLFFWSLELTVESTIISEKLLSSIQRGLSVLWFAEISSEVELE